METSRNRVQTLNRVTLRSQSYSMYDFQNRWGTVEVLTAAVNSGEVLAWLAPLLDADIAGGNTKCVAALKASIASFKSRPPKCYSKDEAVAYASLLQAVVNAYGRKEVSTVKVDIGAPQSVVGTTASNRGYKRAELDRLVPEAKYISAWKLSVDQIERCKDSILALECIKTNIESICSKTFNIGMPEYDECQAKLDIVRAYYRANGGSGAAKKLK